MSICPACSVVGNWDSGCAHSTQYTLMSVTPLLPTWLKLWSAWCLHKVFPCLCIILITHLPQAL